MLRNKSYFVYLAVVMVVSIMSLMALIYPLSYRENRITDFMPKPINVEVESKHNRSYLYPRRSYMGTCKKAYGRVMILIMFSSKTKAPHHDGNRRTMQCYAALSNYSLVLVDIDNDERINTACSKHKLTDYKKYCAAAIFLQDTDWMLVTDENTAVVNPNHCIEEWIDDRVNIIYYENFQDWGISSDSYLVRRSKWSTEFLQEYAAREFDHSLGQNAYDKGSLLVHLSKSLITNSDEQHIQCMRQWQSTFNRDTSLACGRLVLGYQRFWQGAVRFYKKAHGWARGASLTNGFWCESDFLLHDWQERSMDKSTWNSADQDGVNPEQCQTGRGGWKWLPNKLTNCSFIREAFKAYEDMRRANYPQETQAFLKELEVWHCYPRCEID